MRLLSLLFCIALFLPPLEAEPLACGQVADTHKGAVPEWPNTPVSFECSRGFSELALCILNRKGVEFLNNAWPQFVAISDGHAIYAFTKPTHPAYPMILRRQVADIDGIVYIETNGCSYGDPMASDILLEQYKAQDLELMQRFN